MSGYELSWDILTGACLNCEKCALAQGRRNVVIGRGNPEADIMFIGEGPGEQEDIQGKPFVGAAGQLLDKILLAAGFDPEKDVYIANIVKCRPPGNRDPLPEEREACMNYLRYQFLLVRPKITVCLGRISAQAIIDPEFRITREHGLWFERKNCLFTATYHPAALLRDESKKRPNWNDFKDIRRRWEELKGS
ncbi:MAG: uracil-DNA glycosylase [Firmicutes bacterium]|nr:uracil-DNA glycosylase [Bacillota bacterium]